MKSGFLQRLAEKMIGARWYVILVLVVITAVFGSQIPKLKADFTPSDLFANFGDARETAEQFRDTFGNTDNVILVLVEAPDVTTPEALAFVHELTVEARNVPGVVGADRKSTRLNSSHVAISYAVFCLKKKKQQENERQ